MKTTFTKILFGLLGTSLLFSFVTIAQKTKSEGRLSPTKRWFFTHHIKTHGLDDMPVYSPELKDIKLMPLDKAHTRNDKIGPISEQESMDKAHTRNEMVGPISEQESMDKAHTRNEKVGPIREPESMDKSNPPSKFDTKVKFQFFPNPATDYIKLTFGMNDEMVFVRIMDSKGNILLSEEIQANENEASMLDISNIAKGKHSLLISGSKIGRISKYLIVQ